MRNIKICGRAGSFQEKDLASLVLGPWVLGTNLVRPGVHIKIRDGEKGQMVHERTESTVQCSTVFYKLATSTTNNSLSNAEKL